MKKQSKKRRLMQDIMLSLLLVFLIFLAVNSLGSSFLASKQFYDYLDDQLLDSAQYTRSILYAYEDSLPWLISYWSEHSDQLDIPRNTSETEKQRWLDSHVWSNKTDKYRLSLKEVLALPEKEQKVYAELSYLIIADRFDLLANTYGNMHFLCTKKDSASSRDMVLLMGMLDSDSSPYRLGTMLEVSKEDVAKVNPGEGEETAEASYVTASTREIPKTADNSKPSDDEEPDQGDEPQEEVYSYYVLTIPVYDADHNPIASISVGYDRNTVDVEIKESITGSNISIIIRMVVIFVVIILLMRRKIIKPLEIVSGAVRDYITTKRSADVADNLGAMIKAKKKTEIEDLAEDIYDMSLEIDQYTEEIKINTAEKEKNKAEMGMAMTIQRGQLPSDFDTISGRKEFELYASMKPAKAVGGDFYDFFMIDDDHLALLIADVSDKGVPAALFMMTSKTLIKSELQGGKSLTSAMRHVNRQLDDTNAAGMFVTVWAAVVELSTGIVKNVNAGHERPAIRKNGGTWELKNLPHNMVLACLPDQKFTENEWKFEPGDLLFIYTDGVTDATNMDGERFQATRLIDALNQCKKEEPRDVIQAVTDKIAEFVGEAEAFDDTTMLCFRYNGKPGSAAGDEDAAR